MRYSTSVKDLETMACFMVFQEIKELPKKIQKPIPDLRVYGKEPKIIINIGLKLKQRSRTRQNPLANNTFKIAYK